MKFKSISQLFFQIQLAFLKSLNLSFQECFFMVLEKAKDYFQALIFVSIPTKVCSLESKS